MIVYANYGEPNARIIHGRDHDFPDLRTQEHNQAILGRIPELVAAAREIIEEKERKQVQRIKGLIREYHRTGRTRPSARSRRRTRSFRSSSRAPGAS